jgi:hypothetical protein
MKSPKIVAKETQMLKAGEFSSFAIRGLIFRKVIEKKKKGQTWLVPVDIPNSGDFVHFHTKDNQDGYGGAMIEFRLNDGTSIKLKGPWHSNADSLLASTGIDCTKKHLSYGIVALDVVRDYKNGDVFKKVLYMDSEPVIGAYDRIEQIAENFMKEFKVKVTYSFMTPGGGSSGWKAEEKKNG